MISSEIPTEILCFNITGNHATISNPFLLGLLLELKEHIPGISSIILIGISSEISIANPPMILLWVTPGIHPGTPPEVSSTGSSRTFIWNFTKDFSSDFSFLQDALGILQYRFLQNKKNQWIPLVQSSRILLAVLLVVISVLFCYWRNRSQYWVCIMDMQHAMISTKTLGKLKRKVSEKGASSGSMN